MHCFYQHQDLRYKMKSKIIDFGLKCTYLFRRNFLIIVMILLDICLIISCIKMHESQVCCTLKCFVSDACHVHEHDSWVEARFYRSERVSSEAVVPADPRLLVLRGHRCQLTAVKPGQKAPDRRPPPAAGTAHLCPHTAQSPPASKSADTPAPESLIELGTAWFISVLILIQSNVVKKHEVKHLDIKLIYTVSLFAKYLIADSLEWMIQWLTQDSLVSLLDESVFLNESLEWMIQWLTQDSLVSLLDESVFLNESLEWMIQWLTQDSLVSLLDESVFLNESLEWMIQWLTQDSLVSLLDESVLLNESLELMIQWLTQDSLVHYWWINVFEWISWINDSRTHSRFTCFITGWISVFWMNLVNDWFTDSLKIHSFSLLDESVFLNESLEWMIQWLTQDSLVSLLDEIKGFLNESL